MSSHPHDQTRGDSIPFVSNGRTALLSHNEVMALCMKAARGAGMSWGLAEEAGYAAGWLVKHGLSGPNYLYAHLSQMQETSWDEIYPTVSVRNWQTATGMPLCPIALGATLCDYMALPQGPVEGSRIQIGRIDHPVLLIPFLATISDAANLIFDLQWEGGGSMCIGDDPAVLTDVFTSFDSPKQALRLSGRQGPAQPVPFADDPKTTADTIMNLNALALRTTVPHRSVARWGWIIQKRQ